MRTVSSLAVYVGGMVLVMSSRESCGLVDYLVCATGMLEVVVGGRGKYASLVILFFRSQYNVSFL